MGDLAFGCILLVLVFAIIFFYRKRHKHNYTGIVNEYELKPPVGGFCSYHAPVLPDWKPAMNTNNTDNNIRYWR